MAYCVFQLQGAYDLNPKLTVFQAEIPTVAGIQGFKSVRQLQIKTQLRPTGNNLRVDSHVLIQI